MQWPCEQILFVINSFFRFFLSKLLTTERRKIVYYNKPHKLTNVFFKFTTGNIEISSSFSLYIKLLLFLLIGEIYCMMPQDMVILLQTNFKKYNGESNQTCKMLIQLRSTGSLRKNTSKWSQSEFIFYNAVEILIKETVNLILSFLDAVIVFCLFLFLKNLRKLVKFLKSSKNFKVT